MRSLSKLFAHLDQRFFAELLTFKLFERFFMDDQAWAIVIFGGLLVAFAAFASYMSIRQKEHNNAGLSPKDNE